MELFVVYSRHVCSAHFARAVRLGGDLNTEILGGYF